MKNKIGIILVVVGVVPPLIMPIIGAGLFFEVYKFVTSVLFQVVCTSVGILILITKE